MKDKYKCQIDFEVLHYQGVEKHTCLTLGVVTHDYNPSPKESKARELWIEDQASENYTVSLKPVSTTSQKAEQTKRQTKVFSVKSEAGLWGRQFCSWTLACKDMIKVWIQIMPFLKKKAMREKEVSHVTLYTKEKYRSWRIHWRKMLKKTWELSGLKKWSSRKVQRSTNGIHYKAKRKKDVIYLSNGD